VFGEFVHFVFEYWVEFDGHDGVHFAEVFEELPFLVEKGG
jgi:hypothetical protein